MNNFQEEIMKVQSASDKLSLVATDLIDTLENQSNVASSFLDMVEALEGVDYTLDSGDTTFSFDYPSADGSGSITVTRMMFKVETDASNLIQTIYQGVNLTPNDDNITWIPIWSRVRGSEIEWSGVFKDPLSGIDVPELDVDVFTSFLSQARNNVQVLVDAVAAAQSGAADTLSRFSSITGSWINEVNDSSKGLYNDIINQLNTVGESTSGVVGIIQKVYGNFSSLHMGSRHHSMEFNANDYHVSGFIGQMVVNAVVSLSTTVVSALLASVAPVLSSLGMLLVNLGTQISNVWQQLGDSTYSSFSSSSDNFLFAVPLHQIEYPTASPASSMVSLINDIENYGAITIIHPSWITLYWGVYDNNDQLVAIREETYARWSGGKIPKYNDAGWSPYVFKAYQDILDVSYHSDDDWKPHYPGCSSYEALLMSCSNLITGAGGLRVNDRSDDTYYQRYESAVDIAADYDSVGQAELDRRILLEVAYNVLATYHDTLNMGFTTISQDNPLNTNPWAGDFNNAVNNGSWVSLINNYIYKIRDAVTQDVDSVVYSRFISAYYNYQHQNDIYPYLYREGFSNIILKATTLPSRNEFYLCPPKYDKGVRFKLIFAVAAIAITLAAITTARTIRKIRVRRKMTAEYASIAADYERLSDADDPLQAAKDLQKRVRKYNRRAKWYGYSTLSYLNGWENGDGSMPMTSVSSISDSIEGFITSLETTTNSVAGIKNAVYGNIPNKTVPDLLDDLTDSVDQNVNAKFDILSRLISTFDRDSALRANTTDANVNDKCAALADQVAGVEVDLASAKTDLESIINSKSLDITSATNELKSLILDLIHLIK